MNKEVNEFCSDGIIHAYKQKEINFVWCTK